MPVCAIANIRICAVVVWLTNRCGTASAAAIPKPTPADAIPDPKENRLLAALPGTDLQRWLAQLELVELQSGQNAA